MVEAPRVLLASPSSLVAGNYRTIYFTSATPSQQIAAMLMDTVLGKIFIIINQSHIVNYFKDF